MSSPFQPLARTPSPASELFFRPKEKAHKKALSRLFKFFCRLFFPSFFLRSSRAAADIQFVLAAQLCCFPASPVSASKKLSLDFRAVSVPEVCFDSVSTGSRASAPCPSLFHSSVQARLRLPLCPTLLAHCSRAAKFRSVALLGEAPLSPSSRWAPPAAVKARKAARAPFSLLQRKRKRRLTPERRLERRLTRKQAEQHLLLLHPDQPWRSRARRPSTRR